MTAALKLAKPKEAPRWQSLPQDTGPRCHCWHVAGVVDLSPSLPPFEVYVCRCGACGRTGPQATTPEAAAVAFALHVEAINAANDHALAKRA